MFKLNNKLQNDTILIDSLQLSELLLMNDAKYPWFILVPKIPEIVELIDLEIDLQKILLDEINYVSHFLKTNFKADKLNVATLGNVVKQLHVHVVARYENDHTFPDPIWSGNVLVKYDDSQINNIITKYHEFRNSN